MSTVDIDYGDDDGGYDDGGYDDGGYDDGGIEYEFKREEIADFAYRDLERVGAERDIQSDPVALFHAETRRIIRELGYGSDEMIILNAIDRLTFITHKHPLLYVLGYSLCEKKKPEDPFALERVKEALERHGTFNMNDVVRYATHWDKWLL